MASRRMQDKRSHGEALVALLREERPALPLWTPVMLGLGVQIYFWLQGEPPLWTYPLALAAPFAFWLGVRRRFPGLWLAALALLVVALGFTLAGVRTKTVEAPVLSAPLNAAVEGVVREIGRSSSGRPRLRLDELVIFSVPEEATPERAQISLQKEEHLEGIRVGGRISILAHLGPPGGPVEPGGFDYRRTAWFAGLGAIGYANGPPAFIEHEAPPGLMRRAALALAEVRSDMAAGLRARLPGETGAFAAAVTVGERAGVSTESLDALRDSNLAHLLAISGLHMGIVTGLVFGAARLVLAAIPYTSVRWRTKTVAAFIALAAATAYLGLSGATIATQRAYVMAAVALIAVIANRPAITLRALAFAALAILVIRPESLTHVGFQMSFAATAAIIAGLDFGRTQGWSDMFRYGGRGAKIAGYVAGLAATSLLAGLATAPIAAFHFNRAPHYGLIANLLAVPAMGFWVAPSALVAAALAPFGLEGPALLAMGRGIEAILAVARFVAALPGATSPVAAGAPIVLTLIVLGGLGLCLGRRPFRWLGAGLAAAGFVIWSIGGARPPVLVAPGGQMVGLLTPEGRSLDRGRGQGYAARVWLQRDGDDEDQKAASARGGLSVEDRVTTAPLGADWRIVVDRSKEPDAERLAHLCVERTVLIVARTTPAPDGACRYLGEAELLKLGALAFFPDGDGIAMKTAVGEAGDRPWTRGDAGAR